MKTSFLSSLLVAIVSTAAQGAVHVTGKITLGGEGGWDYLTVDSAARRLYVSHATKVVVVDLDTEKVAGEIPDTPGVHGIALATKLNRGFTSNGRGNNVTIFDLKTLKTIAQVKTGENPDAIAYDEKSNRVITFNGRSKDATVFEAMTGKVVATIPLGGKPEFPAGDNKGTLWVNIEDTHEIAVVDIANAKVVKRYVLEGCEEPSGLAMDMQRSRIFSVCGNKVMVISDPASGKEIATLPIGEGSDGAGFDPGTGLAFSSNGEGNLTVVHLKGGKYEVAATVPTAQGARTMTIDPKTHKLYLPAAKYGPAPPAAAGKKAGRPPMLPGSFSVLVLAQ
jgi:DNA-binding beta-propeller fold protein YncE